MRLVQIDRDRNRRRTGRAGVTQNRSLKPQEPVRD